MRFWAPLVAIGMAGCAIPASQVKVNTMTVQEAWTTRAAQEIEPDARKVSPSLAASPVVPVVSAPDIRLAYVRPWKDASGNYHYGGWVALYVDAPKWLLPDGSVDPIERARTRRPLR